MKLLVRRIFIVAVFITLGEQVWAQSVDSIKITYPKIDLLKGYFPITNPIIFEPDNQFQPILAYPFTISLPTMEFNLVSEESPLIEGLSFKQSRESKYYEGLGGFESFKNTFIYRPNRKITMAAGFGLLKQGSMLDVETPPLHYTFSASFEYRINKWLSAYANGQYVSPPINKDDKYYNPFIHLNPMFEQSEVEAGLKAKYKKIESDLGTKIILNTLSKKSGITGFSGADVKIRF